TVHELGLPGSAGQRLPIEPYVRPDLAAAMQRLRPAILAAASRHNRPDLSGMTNREFAQVMVVIIYTENNGWLEDEVEPLRLLRPLFETAQVYANRSRIGSNFTVWPVNLRPSVALEIVRGEVPLPDPVGMITVPLQVYGSTIAPDTYTDQQRLLADITSEISNEELAVAYLAANLERGLYRARYENVPVTWAVLVAWHNQGIVRPDQIAAHPWASEYVYRASAYLEPAHCFVYADCPVAEG
ncbi:MAG: hypothetical protein HC893_09245, partial [Chloroflexaceae bacterium]|nr:hypothetical protein [Chloroflexaceae bacterium]